MVVLQIVATLGFFFCSRDAHVARVVGRSLFRATGALHLYIPIPQNAMRFGQRIGGQIDSYCVQRGCNVKQVWEDILGFENAEFYIKRWPELDGMRFADVLLSFPDAIPCGVKVAARKGKIVLNPDDDYVLAEGDEVLVVADDDDSYAPSTSLPEVPLSCFFRLCIYWCCCCRLFKCTNQSVGVLLLLLFLQVVVLL